VAKIVFLLIKQFINKINELETIIPLLSFSLFIFIKKEKYKNILLYIMTLSIKQYTKENQEIFATLSIQSKYKLLGSSAVKGILYKNDYDLAELATFKAGTPHEKILEIFREKFKEVHAHPDWCITDFKCGTHIIKGQPLRWNKKDIKKGVNLGKKFTDCILEKTTMKLDMVVLVDGLFTEYTENYYIKIGNERNYNPEDHTPKKLAEALIESGKEEYNDRNYFKALKRIYSYLTLLNKNPALQQKLFELFNTQLGLIYKCKSNLDTVITVMEQTFKPVNLEDIKHDLQIIIQILWNISDYELDGKMISKLYAKTKPEIKKALPIVIEYLKEVVNKHTPITKQISNILEK
jgi:hypothetical protein